MKKSTFGILATAALAFTPVAAFANDQTSVQGNYNSAIGAGYGNVVVQDADQSSYQTQAELDGYGYYPEAPDSQLSIQNNANQGAAIGEHNAVVQSADQDNYQTQIDLDAYPMPY